MAEPLIPTTKFLRGGIRISAQFDLNSNFSSLRVSSDSNVISKYYGNLPLHVCTEIANDFDDWVHYQEGHFHTIHDIDSDKNTYIKNYARGTNKHLSYLIDKKESINKSISDYNGDFTFLTLALNYNKVKNVFHNISILRETRNKLIDYLRRDFGFKSLWVWELSLKSGFAHLHLIVLGKIPYTYLNKPVQKDTWVGYEWNRPHTSRHGGCLNHWIQHQHDAFEINSLDWEVLHSRKAKRRVKTYLVDYLLKQQSYFTDYSHSKGKNLDKKQKAYWLGILYHLGLRSFGRSQGLLKGYVHKSLSNSSSNHTFEYIGTVRGDILDDLGAFADRPPPAGDINGAIGDISYHFRDVPFGGEILISQQIQEK